MPARVAEGAAGRRVEQREAVVMGAAARAAAARVEVVRQPLGLTPSLP